ncbi:phage head spike fiber domain-containing protein [Aeromonas veronii]|uniref:phage head spike fiber domain-containing protein n=1 Tax=Aeromonas veronii TaxID=654 RepID=UPI0024864127|nr:LamG-like jellyroll fold domain-containing protein [Aeromonas veronii]
MAGLWQRTGNVTVTNGSRTVTGFGTKWKTGTLPIQKGHAFYGPDGVANEVDTVVSDTEILLVEAYRGGTLANQPYKIDITRTSTISQFSAELSALVGKYRTWFDSMMTWLTGSGDVNILNPDTGATVTIPSWKKVASEGEGQAARAKVEADKAAAAADVAVNVVRDAAAPFPDVWIPFSDSLRMFAGYGREVKVGDDVIARFVNFSRSTTATYIDKTGELKTASINEPRFEKEGLLIEGVSSNLITNTTVVESAVTSPIASDRLSVSVDADGWFVATLKAAGVGQVAYIRIYATGEAPNGVDTFTASVEVDTSLCSGTALVGMIHGDGNGYVAPQKEVAEKSKSFVSFTGIPRQVAQNRCELRIQFNTALAKEGDSIRFRRQQVEKLPFPTSYIPTNGSVVTRAQDVVNIPWKGNIEPLLPAGNRTTAAVEYKLMGSGVSHANRALLYHFGDPAGAGNLILRLNSGQPNMAFYRGAATTSQADVGSSGRSGIAAVRVKADNVTNLFVNGVPYGGGSSAPAKTGIPVSLGIGGSSAGSFPLYGHVRNLRLWNTDLSDSQIKALR